MALLVAIDSVNSTRDGDAAAPREATRRLIQLLAIAARADAVPTHVELDVKADLVFPIRAEAVK